MVNVDSVCASLTVEQIETRLPLVSKIAVDLVDTWAQVLETRSALENSLRPNAASGEADNVGELTEQLDRMVQRVQGYLLEVTQLGGTFQEYRRGIVNFPMTRDGRSVLACWVPGEETIRGWHESHETVAQRKSL